MQVKAVEQRRAEGGATTTAAHGGGGVGGGSGGGGGGGDSSSSGNCSGSGSIDPGPAYRFELPRASVFRQSRWGRLVGSVRAVLCISAVLPFEVGSNFLVTMPMPACDLCDHLVLLFIQATGGCMGWTHRRLGHLASKPTNPGALKSCSSPYKVQQYAARSDATINGLAWCNFRCWSCGACTTASTATLKSAGGCRTRASR